MTRSLIPVVCVMGPTASGKTALGLEVARRFNGEVISVDSALVYQHMDIGTAKPDQQEQAGIAHHLLDVCSPQEAYSAARFRDDALLLIEDLSRRGKLPVLVGGTGFYFRALEQGLSPLPASDPVVRERLTLEHQAKGAVYMHQRLGEIDPVSAERLHPNDTQRILRALEVYEMVARPMSELWDGQSEQQSPLRFIKIAITPNDRKQLHMRIAQRFENMLQNGFINEVKRLRDMPGMSSELPSMRSVGYRQVWQYLDNQLDYETMKEKGITATRQLAKRQLTWLRKESDLHWFDSESESLLSDILSFVENQLEN